MFQEAHDRLSRLVQDGPERATRYKLLHLHIPKTAGISLLNLFKQHFPIHHHLPWDNAAAVWRQVVELDDVQPFTTGHIRFDEIFFSARAAAQPLLLMSVVRDPVQQAVSQYNYNRSEAHPLHETFFEEFPDIETYLDFMASNETNMQSFWLSGRRDNFEALAGAVTKHFCGIAPMCSIDAYASELQMAFSGSALELKEENSLQSILHGDKVTPGDVSPAALERYRAANDIDVRLFESVQEHWTNRPRLTIQDAAR